MSSPQVCGVVACMAETEQNITRDQVYEYIFETLALNGEVGDAGGDINHSTYETLTNAGSSKYLLFPQKRKQTGYLQQTTVGPRNNFVSGVKYPRTNRMVTNRQ